MAGDFTIKGESGAAMNGTARSFETLRITRPVLEFTSMDVDTFSYTSEADNSAGAGVVIPEEGQSLALFEDVGGVETRRFKGVVTRVTPGERAVDVEVSGPWWWMEKIPLTGDIADPGGVVSKRTNFLLPTQGLKTSIEDLLDRMIHADVGIPMTRGTVAAAFEMVKQSLPNMSCAAALVQVLAPIPDAVVWFDYSGTTPEINVSRRGGLTTRTWTVGTSNIIAETIAIRASTGMRVTRVELTWADRHPTTGRIRYQRRSAGTASPGKLLAYPISGPETVEILPKSDFVSAMIQTGAAGDVPNSHILLNDPTLAAVKKKYGSCPGFRGSSVTYWNGNSSAKTKVVKTFPGLKITRANGGQLTDLTGKYLVLTTNLPQWAKEQYDGIDVQITGTWIATWKDSQEGASTPWSNAFKDLRTAAFETGSNNWENATPYSGPGPWGSADNRIDYAALAFSVPGVLLSSVSGMPTNPPWAAAKRVYKAWDYDFVQPPAALEDDLMAAANWQPYEGQFSVIADTISPANQIASKVRIANSRAEFATMDALVKSIRHNLQDGTTQWRLGAPARVDFRTLVNRIKREPADNIVYL